MAEHLGYRHVYILPGGTMAQHLIETLQPIAVFGISCEKEALLGGLLLQEHGITGQIVLLLHDGCVSTKVDLSAVYAILKQKPL